jgi:hypothetical protein
MAMSCENLSPAPDLTICPKHYCFHWLEKGDFIARGFHANLEEASQHMEEVLEDGCGCSLGICLRDERLQSIKGAKDNLSIRDWYEPCEPALDKNGLPHDYFILPKLPKNS